MKLRIAVLVLLAAVLPARAFADEITILDSIQVVLTDAVVGIGPGQFTTDRQEGSDNLSSTSSLPFGSFGTTMATATLTSSISADGRSFSGTGSATASQNERGSSLSGARGQSHFSVGFDLATPQAFQFVQDFMSTGAHTETNFTFWQAILFAAPATQNGPTFINLSGYDSASIQQMGLLAPGRYGFAVDWISEIQQIPGSYSSGGTFALSLNDPNGVSPTPEPASMTLLAFGLAATFRTLRRKVLNL